MKRISIIVFILLTLISCKTNQGKISDNSALTEIQLIDTADMTNNFYDNTDTYTLPVKELIIEGEISNPGKVDFSKFQKHSVIAKETLLDSAGNDRFVGAYRYDGYSLFDILDKRILSKINVAEFKPIIDVFIEVENAKGEKVVFSWGEIYYPNNLHRIIIASDVSRIVPSKTKELWPLPVTSKLVVGNDLVTERNISDPVKITIKSIHKSYPVVKGLSPMYAPEFKLFKGDKQLTVITPGKDKEEIIYNTIFYGRGKGIHSTSPFKGLMLKDVIGQYYPVDKLNLKTGMFCLIGRDGYRCAVSYSEIFNRNDQQEFLLIKTKPDEDGGLFRIFSAADFFSDRAIKSVSEIHLEN